MKTTMLLLLAALGSGHAWCQRFEVTPFAGYKFGGKDVPLRAEDLDINHVDFDNHVSYGASAGYNFSDHWGLEFFWSRQPTDATGFLSTGSPFPPKVRVNLDNYVGHIVYNFRDVDSRLRPFIAAGGGATRIAGSGESIAKGAFSLGGGVKWFFHPNMGLRMQMRWSPTYLFSTPGGIWCNWWGYCAVIPNDHFMNQGEASLGWIFRF